MMIRWRYNDNDGNGGNDDGVGDNDSDGSDDNCDNDDKMMISWWR